MPSAQLRNNGRRTQARYRQRAWEILSPHDNRIEVDSRLKDFFASGTQLAWILNPDTELVEICRDPHKRRLLRRGAELEGERLLPDFRYPIAELFKEWDWE